MLARRACLHRFAILAGLLVLPVGGGAAPAFAADPESDARAIVSAMAEKVLGTITQGADKEKREAVFRELYAGNFENTTIAAYAAGAAYRNAPVEARRPYLDVFKEYVVKAYAYQLSRYKGERLRVDKTEKDDAGGRHDVIVISNLVHPDPRESREIEMRWRLRAVNGRMLVTDVVIDKISMALTERRAFADWIQENGGTLEGLTAKLKQKIAEIDKK